MKLATQRNLKRLCKGCNERWARFQYHGRVRWDHAHDLCPRCWRAAIDHARAERMAWAA